RFSSRVRDVSELLEGLGPRATRHPLPLAVAFHDACHLSHAQGIRAQPRALLRTIPGLELREIAEGTLCCGSAGVYNLVEPEAARALGDRKAERALATEAPLLVTSNPGCLLQVRAALGRRGATIGLLHVVEVLDASLRGVPADRLLRAALPSRHHAARVVHDLI
ncbi:MAG TPA: (Fe-S)-binding protein, partial [Vicinamibacteria bacterium]|nr:(Fe-S)-binding protein [Vicinamibacteria bacterium]